MHAVSQHRNIFQKTLGQNGESEPREEIGVHVQVPLSGSPGFFVGELGFRLRRPLGWTEQKFPENRRVFAQGVDGRSSKIGSGLHTVPLLDTPFGAPPVSRLDDHEDQEPCGPAHGQQSGARPPRQSVQADGAAQRAPGHQQQAPEEGAVPGGPQDAPRHAQRNRRVARVTSPTSASSTRVRLVLLRPSGKAYRMSSFPVREFLRYFARPDRPRVGAEIFLDAKLRSMT
ncbi:hypothetical protein AVEN_37383-1 [Araneus ventricosus]|uniref:Uncharacterized protein n=1 Tax=Araneus ventricosus TaxID=182803 RepID=A0A4Y2LJP5_ARAVE|nr:hypothetical protein AVEN_37383-1 [Araneus ventricosus]